MLRWFISIVIVVNSTFYLLKKLDIFTLDIFHNLENLTKSSPFHYDYMFYRKDLTYCDFTEKHFYIILLIKNFNTLINLILTTNTLLSQFIMTER